MALNSPFSLSHAFGRLTHSVLVRARLVQVLPEVNLRDLYVGLIDPDLEKAANVCGRDFGDMKALRNGCYYALATSAGHYGKSVQYKHPPYSLAAVRAAFPGGSGVTLSDSCQEAMHNEVIPDTTCVTALCSSILALTAAVAEAS